jgi:hypothetical protein
MGVRGVAVRFPDGGLAYHATAEQETTLRRLQVVDEVRSPSGLLRYLRLRRIWREVAPKNTIPAKASGRRQSGLRWLPQLSKAKMGYGGGVAANLLGSRGSRGRLEVLVSAGQAVHPRGEALLHTLE